MKTKALSNQLLAIKALTKADEKGYVYIQENEEDEKYCQLLLDLAIDLGSYMHQLESKIKERTLQENEIEETNRFLSSLLDFFKSVFFFHGKKQEKWIDMVFLLFGISVYYKAILRTIPKTVELFFLSQTFEKMEKIVYNNMYYELTDFVY